MHCTQRAVLRDCGSKPADNSVEINKLLPRRKFNGSRNHAKPPPRYRQFAESAVQNKQMIKNEKQNKLI